MKRGVYKPPARTAPPSEARVVCRADEKSPLGFAPLPPAPPKPAPLVLEGDLGVVARWPGLRLLGLPAAWTMLCRHEHGRRFLVTTSRKAFEAARRLGTPVAHGDDWMALCDAAGQGRACLAVAQWLIPTLPPPELQPGDLPPQPLARALGPSLEDVPSAALSALEVLAHFGAVPIALDPSADQLAQLGQPSGDVL